LRDSYIFYRSFYEAIKLFPAEVRGEIYTAINEYSLYGNETHDMGKVASSIFTLIKPQLDANIKRFENGKKGGAPKGNNNNPNGRRGRSNLEPTKNQPRTNLEPTKNQPEPTKNQPNKNYNDNYNSNANAAQQRASGENFNFSQWRTDPEAQTLLAETIVEWNKIPHVVKCECLDGANVPDAIQREFFHRLHEHGADKIRLAVAKMAESVFWKSKSKIPASFQLFVNEEKFQKLIDGGYDDDFDIPKGGGKYDPRLAIIRAEDYD